MFDKYELEELARFMKVLCGPIGKTVLLRYEFLSRCEGMPRLTRLEVAQSMYLSNIPKPCYDFHFKSLGFTMTLKKGLK